MTLTSAFGISNWLTSSFIVCLSFSIGISLILWQKACKSRPTWIQALDTLGIPKKLKLPGNAVVCGGSIAGIVTARILADHFEHVILVDPELEDLDKPKNRILQYHACHVFLGLFVQGARRLWPDFDAELRAAGGRFVPADTQLHYSGVRVLTPYGDYPPDGLPKTLVMRRATAQQSLQKILLQHHTAANITVVAGTVRSIQVSTDRNCVESVNIRKPDGTHVRLSDVALVADCTGATQGGLKWLANAGISLPGNIRASYNSNMAYTTLLFTVSSELEKVLPIPEATIEAIAIYVHVDTGSSFVGLFKTDHGTMQLLCGNAGGLALPRVASDVVPFLTQIRGHSPIPPWFVETVSILCEYGSPSFNNIKIPPQSYVQYHLLPAGTLPSNFVAIGDANLQLNPVHGQGFAKIMMNGLGLNTLLNTVKPGASGLPSDFSMRYFKNSASNSQGLWDATRLHDYGYSTCQPMEGETNDTGRFARWFELKLVSAATQDEEVASALWHVRHMFATDRALFAPRVLWKILRTRSLFKGVA